MKVRIVVGALSVLVLMNSSVLGTETDTDLPAKLTCELAKLKSETSRQARIQLAEKVADDVKQLSVVNEIDRINDQTLRKITALLDDNDDAIRSWAAIALGRMGPKARSAVPSLERALRRIERENEKKEVLPASDSSSAIQVALRRIAGIPDRDSAPN